MDSSIAKNTWATPYKITFEDHAIRVLEFRAVTNPLQQSVLIVNPQAGHGRIDDYKRGQSLTECTLNNTAGAVHVLDWKGATPFRAMENEVSLQNQLCDAIKATGSSNVHVVGLCQGGWVAALTATNHPDLIQQLTLAGTPIDTSFESLLTTAQKLPLAMYQGMVMMGGGVMRGEWMLKGWKWPNKEMHREAEKDPKNDHFYSWYNSTQDLAGAWYLWAMWNIFIKNNLPKMLDIKCPVNVVVGDKDDITPPAQTLAVQKNCSHEIKVYNTPGGHLGVFTGSRSINETWPELYGK